MSQVNNTIDSFISIADAVSAKYLAQVQIMTAEQGARPPFDDLMTLLKLMEKDLTAYGVKFMEKNRGSETDDKVLTHELKTVIRTTIESFIRQL